MTKGPRRLVLDHYLDSAAPGAVTNAGRDWKEKADDLQELGEALRQAAAQAELRIGEQTLTGPALRAGMEQSATSMLAKSEQLRTAGQALRQVGQQIADTRDSRDALADLGVKPSSYQAPTRTPGVEPTAEEIQAQADASQARQAERSTWQTQYDKQESTSLALTKEMDAAFLGAIPPMKEIHGQEDPTEPPPDVPSGPTGPYLPGTQAPPPTGGGSNGGNDNGGGPRPAFDIGQDDGGKDKPPTTITPTTTTTTVPTTETPTTTPTHLTQPPTVHPEGPTSTVTGSSQNGVTYQPTGPSVSAAGGAGGSSAGASAAALGAAGGGGMAAGAIRPGSMGTPSATSSTPVRSIGSTGRSGSAGALSRSAGSPASRSAGSAAARSAGSAGSPASRSPGSTAGRGASTGSSAGRGGAGGRSSGGRGTSGARSAGAGASGARGGRKGEGDKTTDRDGLVYDQDWLGDDDVAPGVLD